VRTIAVFLLLSCVNTLLLAQQPENKTSSPAPNVILIIGDDQAWTDFGFMGHEDIETPNLDRLAAESLTFTRGYVPTSLCRPSLASIISGLYPSQHDISGNDPTIPAGLKGNPRNDKAYLETCEKLISKIDSIPTIPRLLKSKGYASLQTGKWWEGNFRRGGFDEGMTHGDINRGGRHGDEGLKIGREGLQPIFNFIESNREKPFFVWYAPFLPHTPHNPPQQLLDKYLDEGRPIELAKYYAMCEWFDQTCGELLDYLVQHNLTENTMVIFVNDNGWIQRTGKTEVPKNWGRSFAPRSKQSPYEGGVRTPIMIRWPARIKPAMDKSTLVSSIDIAPTILDACGIEKTKRMSGVSLLDGGVAASKRKTVYGEIFAHDIADIDNPSKSLVYRWLVNGDMKVIMPMPGEVGRYKTVHGELTRQSEFYNLANDPGELNTLKNLDAETKEQLSSRLAKFFGEIK
jgi:arylsulfatase A-like enzyme